MLKRIIDYGEETDFKPYWINRAESDKWANLHFALYYNYVDGQLRHYDVRMPNLPAMPLDELKDTVLSLAKSIAASEGQNLIAFIDSTDFSALQIDSVIDELKFEAHKLYLKEIKEEII